MDRKIHVLYVCDSDSGGVAEYAIRQVTAMVEVGVQVSFLCRPGFPKDRLRGCVALSFLPSLPQGGPTWRKLANRIRDGRGVAKAVVETTTALRVDGILMACYCEYLAPFWAPIYWQLAKRAIPIGTIAHDPVRDFVLGPNWLHRWSVRLGYSFVSHVFVHDDTPVDFGGLRPEGIKIHIIPHGPFEVSTPVRGREKVRQRYDFSTGDRVFLSFGQIRDGKNLDRFLRVMKELPDDVKLLVAGFGGGGSQRSPESYRHLADELGVAERCIFDFRYIPDEETGDLFATADVVLMAYSAKFRSASGVLNAAVACRKPVLASSGEGPLKNAVGEYQLGVWVQPDYDDALLEGARQILTVPLSPEWERYGNENSWDRNVRGVVSAFGW